MIFSRYLPYNFVWMVLRISRWTIAKGLGHVNEMYVPSLDFNLLHPLDSPMVFY